MEKKRNNRGQGLIEYLLLTCLIAGTTIGIVSVVGQNIKEQYKKASAAIRGDDSDTTTFTKPKTDQTEGKGMSDWSDGAKRIR